MDGFGLPRVPDELAKALIVQLRDRVDRSEVTSTVTSAYGLKGKYKYVGGIADYAREVLRVEPTPDQEKFWRLLQTPPYKVLVRSANNAGKSWAAAVAVNHFFDTYDPCMVLTTAPTFDQVKDILWKEVRLQRFRAKDFDSRFPLCFSGPKDPRMETGPGHTAFGLTARDEHSFHGKHGPAVLIVFDESQGIDPMFWEGAETMLGGEVYGFLGIYNPLDSSSQVMQEESAPGYHPVVTMSALDHPNVQRGMRGLPPLIPGAITWPRFKEQLVKWSTPITENEATEEDVRLDERECGGGVTYWRPGIAAESRLLGRWSKRSEDSVWSSFAIDQMMSEKAQMMDDSGPLQIGCDVARFGSDDSTFCVRKGCIAIHLEGHNGWSTDRTASRCMELAGRFADKYRLPPRSVPIAVDDGGVGGGVTDQIRIENWNVIPVNAQACPDSLKEDNQYPNVRSFLWFCVAENAARGGVSIAKLPGDQVQSLKAELRIPRYKMDTKGRRVVESKDDIKKRNSGRSPDLADCFNLSFCPVSGVMGEQLAGRVAVAK